VFPNDGAHSGVRRIIRLRRRDRFGNAAAPIRADDQPAALAQPVDLEGGEKEMQQAGVVTRYL
jgi:hypothetical protein